MADLSRRHHQRPPNRRFYARQALRRPRLDAFDAVVGGEKLFEVDTFTVVEMLNKLRPFLASERLSRHT